MGMYTQFHVDLELKDDISEIAPALEYMLSREDISWKERKAQGDKLAKQNSHELFKCDRWQGMLRSAIGYGADAHNHSRLEGSRLIAEGDIKNYGQEIEHFLDWISPYVVSCKAGTYYYEEMVAPVLVTFVPVPEQHEFSKPHFEISQGKYDF